MSWEQRFTALLDRAAAAAGSRLTTYPHTDFFSPDYRALVPPELAVRDALSLDTLLRDGGERFDLWEPHPELGDGCYRVQLYSDRPLPLDAIIPLLNHLNLRVVDQITFRMAAGEMWLYLRSFAVHPATAETQDLLAVKAPLLDALEALLAGWVENDGLNTILPATGLNWREIDVFRAYRNYYFQLGSRFGRFRFHQALLANPGVAALLFRYFEARFQPGGGFHDPARREEETLTPLRQALGAALERVADPAEDRILRDLFNLIDSTLRTDFYQPKPPAGHAIALKIGSLGVLNMPTPRPWAEIYVHSKLMEGIHLRGARVARGGIRWSDRPDDFRSEILGLMQTQMVKNTLIVPLGAKGGFVLNSPAADPDERSRLARAAYGTFIRGLLNLTDNRAGSDTVPPPEVIAYDDPDPYLVVAADKGTARLSDTANDIAREYGFWLGDAFASGGTHGYHHKQLGITARGAWVCVHRHFREAGQDIEASPFTVVGVGSMDGDVFGNGMLLSGNIRLLGAFGGSHIFLDPNPDPALSFRERKRLFDLPGSTWDDYDRNLVSAGGGVFPRDAKDIPLSPEVRAWLGVRHTSTDGEGLIRLLLAAPADLLWLGGIGTYVKATEEDHGDAADRSNDTVRVDALQIRAKAVGEGANLGFTQKARVEYALAGGRIDTDAVDNSGGVDLSDHEVNLKILMAQLLRDGAIAGEEERNRWLADLAPDVVAAVLANNDAQSLCLSLDRDRCFRDVEPFLDVADRLENAGLLDRAVEDFPTRKEVLARPGLALARPELAVLMAYAKLALKRALLDGDGFLTEPWTHAILAGYFPPAIRERFGAHLARHSLAREITATRFCNDIVEHAGAGFLAWVDELEPAALVGAVTAYGYFDRIVGGAALRRKLHALDGLMAPGQQYALLLQLEDLLAAFCHWALQADRIPVPEESQVDAGRAALQAYIAHRSQGLPERERAGHEQRLAEFGSAGLAPEEARLLALAPWLQDFPALAELAALTGHGIAAITDLVEAVAEPLGVRRLTALLDGVKPRDRWERRAREALLERFRAAPIGLAEAMLRNGDREPGAFLAAPKLQARLSRLRRLERELTDTAAKNLAPFAALGAALEGLREAGGWQGR
jgi:glutamate dehydrogenase